MFFCCATRGGEEDQAASPDEEKAREDAAAKIQARQRGNKGRKRAAERQNQIDAYKEAAAAKGGNADEVESMGGGEANAPKGAVRLLALEIISAKGLRDVVGGRLTGKKSSPFARIELGGIKVETDSVKNNLNPTWNDRREIVDADEMLDLNINISVWHPEVKKKPEICLGRCTLDAKEYKKNGFEGELKLNDTGLKKGDAFIKIKASWAERISAPNNGRISAYKDQPVETWIVRFRAIGLRCGPGVHEERTKVDLVPGEEFNVVEAVDGANGQKFLRLQDGRGWAFMVSAKDGEVLCEQLDAIKQEPVEEEGEDVTEEASMPPAKTA